MGSKNDHKICPAPSKQFFLFFFSGFEITKLKNAEILTLSGKRSRNKLVQFQKMLFGFIYGLFHSRDIQAFYFEVGEEMKDNIYIYL